MMSFAKKMPFYCLRYRHCIGQNILRVGRECSLLLKHGELYLSSDAEFPKAKKEGLYPTMHFANNFFSYSNSQNARTTSRLSLPELIDGGVAGGDGGCVSRGEGRAARGGNVVRTRPQPLVVLHRLATVTSQQYSFLIVNQRCARKLV